jgi:hypothetical protein
MPADDTLAEAALVLHGASITRHDLALASSGSSPGWSEPWAPLTADCPGPAYACPVAAGTATASPHGQGSWGVTRQNGCGLPTVAGCR